MACMENKCTQCDHEWFDNEVRTVCPKCHAPEMAGGKRIILRYFDEQPEPITDPNQEVDNYE